MVWAPQAIKSLETVEMIHKLVYNTAVQPKEEKFRKVRRAAPARVLGSRWDRAREARTADPRKVRLGPAQAPMKHGETSPRANDYAAEAAAECG